MNIYLLSSHQIDPQMLKDLGGSITTQFKGDFSDIHARGNQIALTETLFMGGCTIKVCHLIPAKSIVIVQGSPVLQKPWLDAGVSVLLIMEMEQESGRWGSVTSRYVGLTQIHKIEVVTSPWNLGNVEVSGKEESKSTETQLEKTGHYQQSPIEVPNLFQRWRWSSASRGYGV